MIFARFEIARAGNLNLRAQSDQITPSAQSGRLWRVLVFARLSKAPIDYWAARSANLGAALINHPRRAFDFVGGSELWRTTANYGELRRTTANYGELWRIVPLWAIVRRAFRAHWACGASEEALQRKAALERICSASAASGDTRQPADNGSRSSSGSISANKANRQPPGKWSRELTYDCGRVRSFVRSLIGCHLSAKVCSR